METNKKRYMNILTVITIVCILIGTIYHTGLWAFPLSIGGGNKEAVDAALDAFESVDIESKSGGVLLRTGNEYRLEITKDFPDDVRYEVRDGVLHLKTTGKNKLNFGFSLFSSAKKNLITITIPSEQSLEKEKILLKMGSVELTGITGEKADIELDMGSVTMQDCTLMDVDLSADMGSITIKSSSIQDLNAEADMGSITLSDCEVENLDADADMGSINLSLAGSKEEYTMELKTDMGSVNVDGHKEGKSFLQKGTTGKKITAKAQMGSINIK